MSELVEGDDGPLPWELTAGQAVPCSAWHARWVVKYCHGDGTFSVH